MRKLRGRKGVLECYCDCFRTQKSVNDRVTLLFSRLWGFQKQFVQTLMWYHET